MSRRAPEENPVCTVTIPASTVGRLLTPIITVFGLAYIGGQISIYVFGHAGLLGLVGLFDLDQEANLPSWYSASVLLICSAVLGLITAAKRHAGDRYTRHWAVLALGFLYMSADEEAGLHEIIGPLFAGVGHWLTQHVSGYFNYLSAYPVYTWVLPATAAAAVIFVSYVRFLLDLPRRTSVRFVLSGMIFLGGAMGVEILEARHTLYYGQHDPVYGAMVLIEETMEMAGIALFLVSLIQYAQSAIGTIQIQFGRPQTTVRHDGEQPTSEPPKVGRFPRRRSA
jgi:hypothetical protein